MTDPTITLLFTADEMAGMGRCPDCGWHTTTQGHQPECVHAPPPLLPPADEATRHARFMARKCTDCGAPPSAGRLRCDPCHTQQRKRASDG